MALGCVDPCKVFIKNDPHPASKIASGRCRLIFSVSLLDNLICKILCSDQNNAEISRWKEIWVKPGLGLNDDGLQAIFSDVSVAASLSELQSVDFSGWDWTMQPWEFEGDLRRRIACNSSQGTLYERLLRNHYFCIQRKVFLLSDGTMYQQLKPGVMPSGWGNTASTNSSVNSLDYLISCELSSYELDLYRWCQSMGDDLNRTYQPDAAEVYESMGKSIKFCRKSTLNDFEFCSTHFSGDWKGRPVNAAKMLYNLLTYQPADAFDAITRVDAFRRDMRHHPQCEEYVDLLEKVGWWPHQTTPESDQDLSIERLLQVGCLERQSRAPSPYMEVLLQDTASDVLDIVAPRSTLEKMADIVVRILVPVSLLGLLVLCTKIAVTPTLVWASPDVLNKMPRDCTDALPLLVELQADVQSRPSLWYPIQMTKNRNRKSRKQSGPPARSTVAVARVKGEVEALRKQVAQMKTSNKSKLTPLGKGLIGVGNAIGGVFGFNKIFGSGSYRMNRNSMWNTASQVPFMHSENGGIRLRHREYVTDISTTVNFTATKYQVNPGMSNLFPYLASIAQNFQEYKFHGLIFEYKSTASTAIASSTNLALGTVSMVAQYRADAPVPVSKQDLLNDMWSVDGRPSENIILPVECAPRENPLAIQYVRTSDTAVSDYKFYDLCNFVLATTGSQNPYVAGELWVSYDVEFFKPVLKPFSTPSNLFESRFRMTGGTAGGPKNIWDGMTQNDFYNPTYIGTNGANTIIIPAGVQSKFLLVLEIELAAGGNFTTTAPVIVTNGSFDNRFNNQTLPSVVANATGEFTAILMLCFTSGVDAENQTSINFSSITSTQAYAVDVILTALDN